MKKMILFSMLAVFTGLTACKKLIQQKEQDIIMNAITQGRWYVEQYKQNSTDITGDFLRYEFQFYTNGTVDGINTSTTVVQSGTWTGNAANHTITAAFPPAAGDTLSKLNYTWKITDSYLDYVVANTATASGNNILHLRKKP
jgi:hypothetical protein